MEEEKPGFTIPDPALFTRNMLKVAERGQRLMQGFLQQQLKRQ